MDSRPPALAADFQFGCLGLRGQELELLPASYARGQRWNLRDFRADTVGIPSRQRISA